MKTTRTLLAVAAAVGVLAGCGGGNSPAATASSFEEALGLDQVSIKARMADVQEAIRACMKVQGFDYVPLDMSGGRFEIRAGGMGSTGEDPDTLRKEGYGITTRMGPTRPAGRDDDTDPNQAIRDGLSDTDREAYNAALWGDNRPVEEADGGMRISRRVGGPGEEPGGDDGCFGSAESEVPGGPEEIGNDLRELDERINNDPRLVEANRAWAACMAKSGYTDWEKPDEIPEYLMDQFEALTRPAGDEADSDPQANEALIGQLRDEEMKIARADADCTEETHRAKIAKEVREEQQERFLDEHPNLGSQ